MNGTSETVGTLEILTWAQAASTSNEVVAMFWNKLRDAVNEPSTASAPRILSELQAYGGNTIVNFFREGGVAYEQVAYDVADALRPMFDARVFAEGDVSACETFVLRRMEISEDDLRKLGAAVEGHGMKNAVSAQVTKASGIAAVEVGGVVAAQQVAKVAATAAGKRVIAEAGKQIAKRAAKEAAKRVAAATAKQVLARVVLGLNILLAALTLVSLAGPARRVTIPGVTYVALLRRLHGAAQMGF